ncbi:MAG: hypothetical protein NTU44_12445 [Bacteroidetes bacterium]|nr:hypothetical protein [Bacteroidota bacterium]
MQIRRLIRHLCWVIWLLPLAGQAQQKPYSEEVTVVAAFQPVIQDANKININPVIRDTLHPKPNFTYTILSDPYPTFYKPEPIEPAKMAGEPISKLYENQLKVGFGSYTTPYAEYFFNSTRSKELAYGLHLRHISATGKIKDYGYPGYSNNEVSFFARQFKEKNYNLYADGGFNREVVHYYGFPDTLEPSPSKKDIRQRFGLLHLKGGIASALKDSSALSYHAEFSGYHFFDNYSSKETNLNIEGGIEKTQPLLKVSKEQRWGILGGFNYYNDQTDGRKSSGHSLLHLQPFLQAQRNALQLRIGFNTTVESDSTTFLHFYPEAELKARIIQDWLSVHAGITGYVERNSYRMFTDENPFVDPTIALSFKNTKYKFYGGFNSNLGNLFDLSLEVSQSQVKNQYFYVNNRYDTLQNKFTLLYDDDVSIFELRSELAWVYSQRFQSMFRFHLHQYSTTSALPWHISDYDFSWSAAYNIRNKLLFDVGIIYYDRMYALTFSPSGNIESKYLRDRVDLNLGIEYRYTKLISAFLRLNNLTSIRYYYWNNYPSQKFNLLAGVTFSF